MHKEINHDSDKAGCIILNDMTLLDIGQKLLDESLLERN